MCDVAIIGAGPYGLSAAAHLKRIKGLEIRLFGEPMSFWEQCMPVGMLLRSHWEANHLSDPDRAYSLDGYQGASPGKVLGDPLPAKDFIEYGRWFHDRAGLAAERRKVERIDVSTRGYDLTLEDGEVVRTRRVVLATGIQPFAYWPALFDRVPACLVSHSSQVRAFHQFQGKSVLVIGGGQSALEAASFLREAGAEAHMLIRRPQRKGCSRLKRLLRGNWTRVLYGRGDVGPAGISLIVQRPNLFRCLPADVRKQWDERSHKTWFSYKHVPVKEISMEWGRWLTEVKTLGEKLCCTLNDGSVRRADHVILATGYRVNVALYDFLSAHLLERLQMVDGYPKLDAGLESSLQGLHFLGAPAAWSFGPLVRFVAGTEFLAQALARRVRRAQAGRVKSVARQVAVSTQAEI